MNRFLVFAVLCLLLASCEKEETPWQEDKQYLIKYDFLGIGDGPEESGEIEFCSGGESKQLVTGSQTGGSPLYSSTFGTRIGNGSSLIHIASRLVGSDTAKDTLHTSTLSPHENVGKLNDGTGNVTAYADIEVRHLGKNYATAVSNSARSVVDKFDVNANQTMKYTFEGGGSCRNGDNLIIKTELFYDGYAYNVSNPKDSIKINGLSATYFNYSM